MTVPTTVLELVERFKRNLDTYKRADYKEARVRIEFIDPFFEALGWDMRNAQGHAEQYKEVVHEAALKTGGEVRAPDYSFRLGGVRKFFLEAKKPAVQVKGDVSPAYQLRRYAWSAKLPLSILTDFEEFAVYDCRQKPKPGDKASVGRVMYFTFEQYLDHWDDIYNVFAKESLLQGSFDRYAQDTRGKRGTGEVDAAFLKEIEGWRETLAHNIALRNPALTIHELNFAVQRTIDRVIFLRMTEDRGIEDYGQLRLLTRTPDIYAQLIELYRHADEKYNAGIFDFQADTLTRTLTIDDKVLKPILADLYYPQSPYEFSVLPANVLGQVYEQFLGKVIRLTPGHRAKVEEKPEVKKAGGVYYTPTYIVDYIVKQTVGKLIEGKTPQQISKLRILDPACGSGSFLLGAYQYLLDHHLRWYEAHDPVKYTRRKQPPVYQGAAGEWRLTTAEKKRVLLNNIYGVDIDRQAVEVTKLSLLLQVLAGETNETLNQQLRLWQERALPNLGDNIKCGNSLIGSDYFAGQLLPDEEEMRRVNPFDWERGFPEAMAAGGFDVVIGNPPWVQAGLIMGYKDCFKSKYETYTGSSDIYVFFIEQSFWLLNKQGEFGMIISNKWLRADYGRKLRSFLSSTASILQLVDFGELPVFKKVGTFPCILLSTLRRDRAVETNYIPVKTLPPKGEIIDQVQELGFLVNLTDPSDTDWTLVPPKIDAILVKMTKIGASLGDYCKGKIRRGVVTGCNPAFIIDKETREKLIREDSSAEDLIKPFVSGNETRRYSITWRGRYIIFTRRGIDISRYPSILAHLFQYREQLEPKKNSKDKVGRKPGRYEWYEIQDSTSYYKDFEEPKIVYGQFQIAPHFAFSPSTLYFGSNHYMIVLDDIHSLLYLCGILNSDLYFFYMKRVAGVLGDADKGGRLITQKTHMLKFPVRTINFDDPEDIVRHDKMVALVERMLKLHQKLTAATIPDDKELCQRQIESTDQQIDALVYELYGLTEEEIAIVERQR